jgi:hypothetical protein
MRKILLLLALSAAAFAQTPAFVNGNMNSLNSGVQTITLTLSVTAGNQILLGTGNYGRTVVSVTDNSAGVCGGSSNTYTLLGSDTTGAWKGYVYFVSSISCTGSIDITVDYGSSQAGGAGPNMVVNQYTNVSATVDAITVGPVTPSGSTYTCGSVTTTNANDLVFSAISGNNGGGNWGWSVAAPFTLRTYAPPFVGSFMPAADDIVSSTGTYTPAFTATAGSTSTNVCTTVAMKAGTPPTNLCSSVKSGNASDSTVWTACGGGTPTTSGYTAKINDGHTVTWDATGTTGLGTTTAAITLNNTGVLNIAAGVALTVDGPITYTGGTGNTTDGITMQAGSSLIGVLASGVTQLYGAAGANGRRGLNTSACTAGSRCTISASGSGASTIGDSGSAGGGNVHLAYTDLTGIGASGAAAIYVDASTTSLSYDVQHCTFTNSGVVNLANAMAPAFTMRHSYNAHTGNLGGGDIAITATANLSGGVREVKWNSLPGGVGGSGVLGNVTFTDNFNANGGGIPGSGSMDFERNITQVTSTSLSGYIPSGTVKDNYVFFDTSMSDPHMFNVPAYGADQVLDGFVVEQSLYNGNSGVVFYDQSNSAIKITFKNTILLPTTGLGGNGELLNPQATLTTTKTYATDHNTLVAIDLHYGHMNMNETGNSTAGQYVSIKNNLFYSNPAYCVSNCIAKTWNNNCGGTGTTNVVAPANADYNAADSSLLLVRSGCLNDTNQGNGYNGVWTVTPGAHDMTASPSFIDAMRSLIFFPSKYSGITAAAWVTSTAYSVGDVRSDFNASVFGGLTILYRCISAHTSGSTTEPGVGASWQTKWEWYGLYQIRSDYVSHPTYIDGALPGCTAASPCSPAMARIAWARRGHTPTNPLLRNAGSDGTAPGAVDMDRIFVPVMQ